MGEKEQPQSSLSAADQVYRRMVLETAQVPVVFLDPDAFNRQYYMDHGKTVDPADISVVRNMIESQMPGAAANASDEDMAGMVARSMNGGPFALRLSIPPSADDPDGKPRPFGLVNLQGRNNDQAHEYLPGVAAHTLEFLSVDARDETLWDGFWGIHEGNHINQPEYSSEGMTPDERALNVMNRELESDLRGMDWLARKGRPDLAQDLTDYRALSATSDPTHSATAILSDEPGTQATLEHFQASRKFVGTMWGVVANDLGIGHFDAMHMHRSDEETFNGHVQRLLTEGAFDNADPNPNVREYIEAYSGAVQRQITDRRVAQEMEANGPDRNKVDVGSIKGGTPVVTLNDGDQATLRIGGVSAVTFFAANADPVLAEQRIAMLEANTPVLDTEFTRSTSQTAGISVRP